MYSGYRIIIYNKSQAKIAELWIEGTSQNCGRGRNLIIGLGDNLGKITSGGEYFTTGFKFIDSQPTAQISIHVYLLGL